MIVTSDHKLIKKYDGELIIIEPWGNNSLRFRAFPAGKLIDENFALLVPENNYEEVEIKKLDSEEYYIRNGNIYAILDHRDRITYYNNNGDILLKEFIRLRAVKHDDGSEDVGTIQVTRDFNSTLKLKSRQYRANFGGDFEITTRFESNNSEKIFGMGQYQHEFLDLKYTSLELAQRNSQISVPFYISNLNYGFLWNNPGIGIVNFAKNLTEWNMKSTYSIDYWITSEDTPKKLINNYTEVTGRVPIMPKKLLGLWQSKLRYRTPEEVLDVVKRYKEKNIQLSTIAIDYFHWSHQGEYRFDENFWPNPEKLVDELKNNYKVEPIISVWPTVQSDAENYDVYLEEGYMVNVNRGVRLTMQIQGTTVFVDTTNPEATEYVWSLLKKNYKDKGIDYYWIDVAEPGYAVYDFDNYRYYKGTVQQVGNLYPIGYLKMIYDGNKDYVDSVVTLVRGAWAGAQRYGALAWSGDIDSSFKALRNQVNTGLNVGLAGLPWWTTDTGGFHGGDPRNPTFRQLIVRWFQYSTFSPILRMHGDRLPHSKSLSNSGGGKMPTGAPNEIWSYGEEAENIFIKYLNIREIIREYIYDLMVDAHETGNPLMRTLFYEFPSDKESWNTDNEYMFGEDLLVAPIIYENCYERKVYFPKDNNWIDIFDKKIYEGGKTYIINAPIDKIPVFVKFSALDKFKDLVDFLNK
ncbi:MULTISPECIES: glycoside hydrolase family 31 protein [Anaerococcus]|uniref:glycoside hydrolase family 31 protein n=1 Tax=Anaerococcus TaxID=165779 RepID=UPI001C108ED7|nr:MULTISPECIES: TIM-barrel domain-containing protein [Anaerococcus]